MFWPNRQQFHTLGWIYFAYVMCYSVRKNYPMILPSLGANNLLTQGQAGFVASIFQIVVGIVKFFCGVYVDSSPSPGLLLAKCLLVAGVSCLAMQVVFWTLVGDTFSTLRVALVTTFWSANGAGQAVAWPALARVFLAWFPDPATRGTWYSILATNQNIGSIMAPLVYPPVIETYGWEVALYVPAIIVVVYALFMSRNLKSHPPPAALGGTPEGILEGAPAATVVPTSSSTAVTHGVTQDDDKQISIKKIGFIATCKHLLSMPSFVMLSIAYIPIMLLRQSMINWTVVIFNDVGMSLFEAGACISALEFGGFVGGLTGGYLSDRIFNGRRGPIMVIFSLLCTPLSLILPHALTASDTSSGFFGLSKLVTLQLIFFGTGFASFPPHSLIGLMSREISPSAMRSTAGCLAKATGQLGAAAAGWPLQALAQHAGWTCVGYTNAIAGVLAALAFAPLWSQTASGAASITKRS